MFPIQKKIIVGFACAVAIGFGIFTYLGGVKPPETPLPEIIQDESPPLAYVGEIMPLVTVNPGAIKSDISNSGNLRQQTADDPVFAPANDNSDVVVPFIPEVSRPNEAEIDPDKHNHDYEEGADKSEPPTIEPPRQPVTEPPKQNEPKGGDTNSQGQVWVPGFGWVTPDGSNQSVPGHSDGDINKQVGSM